MSASIEFADGDACGAIGCTTSKNLVRINADGRTRTLCMHCASRYTNTEVQG